MGDVAKMNDDEAVVAEGVAMRDDSRMDDNCHSDSQSAHNSPSTQLINTL